MPNNVDAARHLLESPALLKSPVIDYFAVDADGGLTVRWVDLYNDLKGTLSGGEEVLVNFACSLYNDGTRVAFLDDADFGPFPSSLALVDDEHAGRILEALAISRGFRISVWKADQS